MTFFGPDIRNGLPISLGSMAGFGRRAFTPSVLFAAGEQGFWYDPSDLGTLYQDSAGTTPVTAVEQAVGLILDKSKGLVLSGELATNGSFATDSGWTKETGWTISGGKANKAAGVAGSLYQAASGIGFGDYCVITFTVSNRTAGSVIPYIRGTQSSVTASANGTYTAFARANTDSVYAINFYADASFDGSIDDVSVRKYAGNHAIQPGATNRPILRSRYNRITRSEEFNHADWFKVGGGTGSAPVVTANDAVAPDGTTTADLIVFDRGAGNAIGDQSYVVQSPTVVSGTYTQYIWLKAATAGEVGKQLGLRNAGGSGYGVVTLTADWVRYTRTETGSSGNWELNNRGTITTGNSVSAHVWGADFRSANDTYLPYQRIAAATDYDTVGFPVYLAFDGSDDSLYTGGNVDFSATDRMTVFAGVTKLSDAAGGMIHEHGASGSGTFYLYAPGSADYQWRSGGTLNSNVNSTTFAAPITNVVTGIGDISGDVSTIRVDGAQSNTGSADQGTGNYANAVLNIGRRNNSSLPFNGRLYQLIGRGAATSAALITQAERWVAGKQGRAL